MNESIWSQTELKQFESVEKDIKTDVLIIGGGLAGLLCAYFLHNRGVDYVLVEKDTIAGGITKNTTGKITSQHGLCYADMVTSYGKEKAQLYLTANERAVGEYKRLADSIDCDFEIKDAYTYSLQDREIVERETDWVNKLGLKAEFCTESELPFDIKGAIKFANQAQFNPMKFIKGISDGLNIYEESFVRTIEGNKAITDKGRIQAEKIIVATHFPFINKHGSYFLKLYQHRSYVSAYKCNYTFEGMYVDENKRGMSFRSYQDMIIIGGGGHRTGKMGGAWSEIDEFADKYYPEARLEYKWAAQDCMSLDAIPYIGRYSNSTPNLFVASGFNKWGMSSSMVAATMLTDMVLGKKSEYEELFSPQRGIIKPQLFVNGFESVVNLLTPTLKRCPHLGCSLKWNKAEHTWDCPCHGSRFEENGRLIDNPAKRGLD